MLAYKKDPAEKSQFQTQIIVSENSWAARMSESGMRRLLRGNGRVTRGPRRREELAASSWFEGEKIA